ncbi:MAG: hypothetical protein ABI369_05055, partial [Acetobacteraceae bacterium]
SRSGAAPRDGADRRKLRQPRGELRVRPRAKLVRDRAFGAVPFWFHAPRRADRRLHASFVGIDETGLVELTVGWGDEYVTQHSLYGFEFHTGMYQGRVDEAALLGKLARERFPLLARMLMEDLATGDKLLVFRAEEAGRDAEASRLLAAIRSRGPASLLWVTLARDAAQVGTVRRMEDGLLVGYLDRLAPLRDARALSFEAWLSICTAAHAL